MKSNSTLCTVHADDVGVEVLFLGILCCLSCVSSVKSITGAVVDDFFCRFFAGADADPDADADATEPPLPPVMVLPAFSVDDFRFFDVAAFLPVEKGQPPPPPVTLFVPTIPEATTPPVAKEERNEPIRFQPCLTVVIVSTVFETQFCTVWISVVIVWCVWVWVCSPSLASTFALQKSSF